MMSLLSHSGDEVHPSTGDDCLLDGGWLSAEQAEGPQGVARHRVLVRRDRGLADGVRRDADKGKHHYPDGVRSSVASRPGTDPDTAHVNPSVVHLDADPKGGGFLAAGEGPASARSETASCGGGPVAEVVFPPTLAELDQLDLPQGGSTDQNKVTLAITVPVWPVGKHGEVARGLVTIWRRMSRKLVGLGHRTIQVASPLHPDFYSTPGLFGCPLKFAGDGDDHWRVAAGPKPTDNGKRGVITLSRRSSADETRRRYAVRAEGNHLLVVAREFRRGHRAATIGFVRAHDGSRTPIPVVESKTRPNSTTAVCEALVSALERLPDEIDLCIWTPDGLVRSAMRRWYVGPRGEHVGEYTGVGPPQMEAGLRRLQERVLRRAGATHFKRVTGGAAIAFEIVGVAAAIDAVRAFGVVEVGDVD